MRKRYHAYYVTYSANTGYDYFIRVEADTWREAIAIVEYRYRDIQAKVKWVDEIY